MTIVVVTHKMSFVRDAVHKVIFMNNGVVVEVGAPNQIFENTRNERLKQFLSMIGD